MGSVWDGFGVGLGLVSGRFGIGLGTVWSCFVIVMGSFCNVFVLCWIAIWALAVLVLFADIFLKGKGAFSATYIQLEINYDQDVLGIDDLSDEGALMLADWDGLHKTALRQEFPQVRKRSERRELYALVSNGAGYDLKERLLSEPELLDQTEKFWILADDDIDTYYKSLLKGRAFTARLSLAQLERVKQLIDQDRIELQFNANFLSRGDSLSLIHI